MPDKHHCGGTLSINSEEPLGVKADAGRQKAAQWTGDNTGRSLPGTSGGAQFTVESLTADGVQGSELAPRGHVHTHGRWGWKERQREEGWKNNDIKARTAKVERGGCRGRRGGSFVWARLFVCLCMCVCVIVVPMREPAKFTGPSTVIVPIHWLINRPDLMCSTCHCHGNFTWAAQGKAVQTH